MATSSHDKRATGYPLRQTTPAAGFPSATAYCAVPPSSFSIYYLQQQQPTPTTYYTPSPRRGFTSTFLCRLFAGIAAAFTLVTLITFITWLVLKPQFPEFRVVSASVSSLNTTGSDLSAQWDITLVATNPNHKLRLYYDSLSAAVFYARNRFLANTRYPPLLQHTGSENTVNVKLAVVGQFIGDDVARAIAGDKARGFVQFGFRLSAWLRFNSGFVWSRYHLWEAVCYPLDFHFSFNNDGNGTLTRALSCE